MKKKKWVLPVAFLGFCLIIVFVVFKALTVASESLAQKMNQYGSFPDGWSYETGVDIENFPGEYRKLTLSLTIWSLVWYQSPRNSQESLFQNAQLKEKWLQIIPMMQERHPILDQSIPEDKLAALLAFQEVATLKEHVGFLNLVNEIEHGESGLRENPDWVEAKQNWETKRTQITILGIYLIFLDDQSGLDANIYEELNTLISTVGSQNWFEDFSEHLDRWWPSG